MLQTKITTPVLFLVFNRPEKTQQVFDVIKQAKPTKLYVAADAPRNNVETDLENCKRVREIVSTIDWDCEVKYLFHDDNLGCSLAGITAWNWLFSQEEEMIFLEDDGLVSISFFSYCQELLEKYRYNNNVAYIGGVNYGLKSGNGTYFFSRTGSGTYAMATWKRVHNLYEYRIESYLDVKNGKAFKSKFVNNFAYKYFCSKFEDFISNGGNTYDLQMIYLVHKYDMINIVPNINLCTNIGFDEQGTNTIVEKDSDIARKYGNRSRFNIEEIVHPVSFKSNKKFEKIYFKFRVFDGISWKRIYFEYYFILIFRPLYRNIIKPLFK